MSKKEIAQNLFTSGYNCAQAVLLAFAEDFGLDQKTAANMAFAFGGGMAQMRETCGVLTGAFMVLGLSESLSSAPTPADKSVFYQKVRALAENFTEENGSMLCRELLAAAKSGERGKKSCKDLVGDMADYLESLLP